MPNPVTIQLLSDIRRNLEPSLSQAEAAKLFNVGRQTFNDWETGKTTPSKRQRDSFIVYLLDTLRLRNDIRQFEKAWNLLALEWEWEPLSNEEKTNYRVISQQTVQQSTKLVIPPPQVRPIPQSIPGFVGRRQQLIEYADQLTSDYQVVIAGMAGVGKTTLALRLIDEVKKKFASIFWHSCAEGYGVDSIIWHLAGFLAQQGQDELWNLLQQAAMSSGKPPPNDLLLDYLFQLLRGGRYLLCFDDLHLVENDPKFQPFIKRVESLVKSQGIAILITTRRTPDFMLTLQPSSLGGLNNAEVHEYIANRKISLTDIQTQRLAELTEGNTQFLTLAVYTLQRERDVESLLAGLAQSHDIQKFLMQEVDNTLSQTERRVMIAVACLLGYPGRRDLIETVSKKRNLVRTLLHLVEFHLLSKLEGGHDTLYFQHTLIREFYYEYASTTERLQLHRLIATYYTNVDKDLLRAGIHYERAGENRAAAEQTTSDVWKIINQGHVHELASLVSKIDDKSLDSITQTKLEIARGICCSFLGKREEAVTHFHSALTTSEQLPIEAYTRQLRALACKGMVELLEIENPTEALEWIKRGLAELGDSSKQEKAAFLIWRGTEYLYLGDYDSAKLSLEDGLALVEDFPSQLRGAAFKNMGSIYLQLGDIDKSIWFTDRAIQISRHLNDHFEVTHQLMNRAIPKYIRGDWLNAISDWQEAHKIALSLGSEKLRAEIEFNLGAAYINTGNDEESNRYLQQCLDLCKRHNLQTLETQVLFRLGDLHIRTESWHKAEVFLIESERLAKRLNQNGAFVSIYRAMAEAKLGLHQLLEATLYGEQALALAREQEEVLEEAECLRALGQVLAHKGKKEQAIATFQQSLTMFDGQDPYEAARTKVQLAFVYGQNLRQRSVDLLNESLSIFMTLNAKRDVKNVKHILDEIDRS